MLLDRQSPRAWSPFAQRAASVSIRTSLLPNRTCLRHSRASRWIGKKVSIKIRQMSGQSLGVGEHIGELLGHRGWVVLIVINSQSLIALSLVGEQTLQRRLLQEAIHLLVHVGSRPIDRSVKLFDGACGQLNLTIAGRALLQGLDLIVV